MGEIVEVDVRQLRTVADRVMDAADHIAELRWPVLEPDDLQGSAVGRVTAPVPVAAGLTEVAASFRDWAVAAHKSADEFERAERRSGDRFVR